MSTPEIKLKNVTQVKEYVMTVEDSEGNIIGEVTLKRYRSGELEVTNGNIPYDEELEKAIIEEFSKHI